MRMILSSDYIVGLTDGEGSFCVFIRPPKKRTWNTREELHFYIKMREDDFPLLKKVQRFFGCGRLAFQKEYRENQRDNYRYQVSNRHELETVIIPFFRLHPLQSKRIKDFNLFCQVFDLVKAKCHHESDGLNKIITFKKSMHQ